MLLTMFNERFARLILVVKEDGESWKDREKEI